jgi:ribonuclease BN (tRNA processing enzyme)
MSLMPATASHVVLRRLVLIFREIGTIFITHHHDDHTAGLGTLLSLAWDQQRTKPINVYGPPRTAELVKAAVQYFTISGEISIADGGRTVPIAQMFFGHDVGTGVISGQVLIAKDLMEF